MYVWSSSKRLANERRRGPESNGEKGDASSLRTSSDRKRAEVTRSALWVESQNRSPLGRATNFPNKAGAGVGEGGGRGGARSEGGHTKKSAFIPRPPAPCEAQLPTPYQITSSTRPPRPCPSAAPSRAPTPASRSSIHSRTRLWIVRPAIFATVAYWRRWFARETNGECRVVADAAVERKCGVLVG